MKKYKRPKNLNELAYAMSELYEDVGNKTIDNGRAKTMVGAASAMINISKIHAIQNESAIKSGEINLMQIEFGKFPEPSKGISIAETSVK
jgi:hypothetical protein